jgi:transcriptional antiterminator RfaH
MSKFQMGWYLIYTRVRHEKKVHSCLLEKKIESFLPTRKILRTWCDRKKYVEEPLFPSYIFIHLKDMQNYYAGLDAEGSLYYIKAGRDMARISDEEINNIKLVTDKSKDIEVSYDYFQPGRKLVISQGALTGLACEVIRFNGNHKLLVRVELLQRSVLLTMEEKHLMAL